MIASYWPSSSLRSRVLTLPRNGSTCKSASRSRSCASRRRLDVPIRAPPGRLARSRKWFDTKASRGSSRAPIAASTKPSGISIGTSFSEWTARSARPSAIATSSSLMKRPLPPMSASGRSTISSPRVVIPMRLTAQSGWSAARRARMCSACHRASADSRVAIVRRRGAGGVAMAFGRLGARLTRQSQFNDARVRRILAEKAALP